MRNLKCIIGSTGIVTKGLKTNLEAIPGIQESREEKAYDKRIIIIIIITEGIGLMSFP